MKVAFLDRDGIVNVERGDYTWRKGDFQFTTDFFVFSKTIHDAGFQIIIITNQGGIEKGKYALEDVNELHKWMKDELRQHGVELLDIFFCPHHDSFQKCLCRKPASLLIEKAIARYSIDADRSFMIGDRPRDVEAAEAAGVKGVLIDSNPKWSEFSLGHFLP